MLDLLRKIKRKLEEFKSRILDTNSSNKNKIKVYRKLGISSQDIRKFKRFSIQHKQFDTFQSTLLEKPITTFNNYYWYYHSIDELFVDEVYKCILSDDTPYILDCGANIGLSIIYFKQQWPNAKIVAFEPDTKNFFYLTRNMVSFQLSNVTAINKGVWKEETNLRFFSDGHLGGTVMHSDFSNSEGFPDTQFVRLRDYLDVKVDFLKIDIEGAEYEVIKDIRDKLVNVEYLFVEFHGAANQKQTLHEILLWISEAGFRYYIKSACENQKHPFIEKRKTGWDLQLNICCYR
jgi:FkbM family methyltransferase